MAKQARNDIILGNYTAAASIGEINTVADCSPPGFQAVGSEGGKRIKKTFNAPPRAKFASTLNNIASSLSIITAQSFLDILDRHPLVFIHPPDKHDSIHVKDLGYDWLKLDPDSASNEAFLQYEEKILEIIRFLTPIASTTRKWSINRRDHVKAKLLLQRVYEEQTNVLDVKKSMWECQQRLAQQEPEVIHTGQNSGS